MLRLCSLLVLWLAAAPALAQDFEGRISFGDADSLNVGGIKVRLFGIDAPEMDQACAYDDGSRWACGRWAAQQARRLFNRKWAECQLRDIDQYDRAVATCFVDGRDIAEILVGEGLATAYLRYATDYAAAEKVAAVAKKGIWAGSVQSPEAFRNAQREAQASASQTPPGECLIKGNISGSGRIYHLPGQENYDDTVISASKGERWFCSEAEARAAGWRRARR